MTASNEQSSVIRCLREALKIERDYLSGYEKPCEPIAYETLRTLDDLFCRHLMEPWRSEGETEKKFRTLSTWGVNHALRRIVPKTLGAGPFRDFPSREDNQSKADDFVFHCGVLAMAERLEGWLDDGILSGELQPYSGTAGLTNVLVLRDSTVSCSDEEIGRAGLRWASAVITGEDLNTELALEARHRQIALELEQHVELLSGWRTIYSTTRKIDDYFMEWARLYLRRIFSQDMLGLDDMIGGRPFSRYLEVLTALSARSQKHIAFAAILRARHPSAHIRNLLTTYCPRQLLIESLANYLNADFKEIEGILQSLILSGENLDVHTRGGEPAWAPIVRASTDMILLPVYGLEINPFLFLLNDLRFRYESDWFRVANNRERRWVDEMAALFSAPGWETNIRNLRLRQGGKVLTDIDFATYNSDSNELAVVQLKWQQPVGIDNRKRRSAGKNLIDEGNRWTGAIFDWLKDHGVDELMKRLNFASNGLPKVTLYVIGRYQVYLSGFDNHDNRAIWSDWAHFRKAIIEAQKPLSLELLSSQLLADLERSRTAKRGESTMFPLGNIAVVVNPTSVPQN